VVKSLGTSISTIGKKNKMIEELACTYRICGLSFVGHRVRISHSASKGAEWHACGDVDSPVAFRPML
jgi:hypothetical protein